MGHLFEASVAIFVPFLKTCYYEYMAQIRLGQPPFYRIRPGPFFVQIPWATIWHYFWVLPGVKIAHSFAQVFVNFIFNALNIFLEFILHFDCKNLNFQKTPQ